MSNNRGHPGSECDPILATALDAVFTIDENGSVVELNPAAEELFGYSRVEALGRPLAELIFPPELRAAHRARLGEVLSGDPSRILGPRVVLTLMRADGGEFPVERVVTQTAETPPRFTAWIRDLSERKPVDARRNALERADREIAAHLAVSKALSVWGSLEQGAERLLRDLAAALGFAVGALWLPRGDVLEPRLFCSVGSVKVPEYERATGELRLPMGVGLPGRAWDRREPVDGAGNIGNTRFVRGEAAARDGLRSRVAIPALVGEDVLAVIELCSKEEVELTDRLKRLLSGVGYELGTFLARRRGELKPPRLTARQLQILQLAGRGFSGPEIAEQLVISRATVKTHFEHIYENLEVSDRAAAVARAMRDGLIQ
jgi:PAS domain S-box-containing protein